jgi:hypothetical protein
MARGKRGVAGPQVATPTSSSSTASLSAKLQNMKLSANTNSGTPPSSAYASAYPTEDEDDTIVKKDKGFRFLDLPSELRTKVYTSVFAPSPLVIDLDPWIFKILTSQKLLSLFRVSRQIHLESTHHFFSTHVFRLFPVHPGRYIKTKKPLLARLPVHYRNSMTSLELRLGPGWNNPPRGWVVNEALGLADCRAVRVLKVFVEADPSDAIYSGWRMGEGLYEAFCAGLLTSVLDEVPTVKVVEFDGFPGVKRTGGMMAGLGEVVNRYDKVVGWGPERGWSKEVDQVLLDAVLIHGPARLSKSAMVFG